LFLDFAGIGIFRLLDVRVFNELLEGYHDRDFVIDGFSYGFSLGVVGPVSMRNHCRPGICKAELADKLNVEIERGCIIGPFKHAPTPDLVTSPVCVVPKPNGKWRLIFNLSFPIGNSVNDSIPDHLKSVSYCTVNDAVRFIVNNPRYSTLCKLDLKDAYRMVPIKRADWKYLGMYVSGEYLVDRCLPMGAASSCQIFQRISDAISYSMSAVISVPHRIFNYLDDFLIITESVTTGDIALAEVTAMVSSTNLPVSHEKTVHPCGKLVFLGIVIDAQGMSLSIPLDKRIKILADLQEFILLARPKVRRWQSVLGQLNHVSQVVLAGRAHMNSLYGAMKGIMSANVNVRRRVPRHCKADLALWADFLSDDRLSKPFSMICPSVTPSHHLWTDASSLLGYGGTCGSRWFYGSWPDQSFSKLGMSLLELYPIFAAIIMWTDEFSDDVLVVHTDNEALVPILSKLYSRDSNISAVLRPLALQCMKYNICIQPMHVAGKDNVAADLLSRQRVDEFHRSFTHMDSEPTDLLPNLTPGAVARLWSS